jgi:uncharacterized protein (TIGR02646 family)
MRTIHKGTEPPSFTEWKALANENWQPNYGNLQTQVRRGLHEALVKEQHGICCYCEGKITVGNSHVEHQMPQASDEGRHRTVDYSNLLASCLLGSATGVELHCGRERGNWNTPDYISPLEADCASHFVFLEDGQIKPIQASDTRAVETIRHLGLNKRVLQVQRQDALDGLFGNQDLEAHEIRQLAAVASTPDSSGNFDPGFPTMFEYLYLR